MERFHAKIAPSPRLQAELPKEETSSPNSEQTPSWLTGFPPNRPSPDLDRRKKTTPRVIWNENAKDNSRNYDRPPLEVMHSQTDYASSQ